MEMIHLPIFCCPSSRFLESLSAKVSMSDFLQTVVRGPSFIGLGKRPSLQPCHHELLLMGKISSTWVRRRNTHFGFSSMIFTFYKFSCSRLKLSGFFQQPRQIISPFLHHCPPLIEILGIVIGASGTVTLLMGKLALYPVPVVAKLIQDS